MCDDANDTSDVVAVSRKRPLPHALQSPRTIKRRHCNRDQANECRRVVELLKQIHSVSFWDADWEVLMKQGFERYNDVPKDEMLRSIVRQCKQILAFKTDCRTSLLLETAMEPFMEQMVVEYATGLTIRLPVPNSWLAEQFTFASTAAFFMQVEQGPTISEDSSGRNSISVDYLRQGVHELIHTISNEVELDEAHEKWSEQLFENFETAINTINLHKMVRVEGRCIAVMSVVSFD